MSVKAILVGQDRGTDAAYEGKILTGVAYASAWTNGQQIVTVTGLGANDDGTVGLAASHTDAQYNAAYNLDCIAQAANSVTLKALGDVPTIDLPIEVRIPAIMQVDIEVTQEVRTYVDSQIGDAIGGSY